MTRTLLSGAALGIALFAAPQLGQAAPVVTLGQPAAAQTVDFSVHLPLRNEAALENLVRLQADPTSPLYHHFLSVQQFRAAYGPTPATFARAEAALRAEGFTITRRSSQSLRVSGSAANVQRAFATTLGIQRAGQSRTRIAALNGFTVPTQLQALGATVGGLEARVHNRVDVHRIPLNRKSGHGGYYFTDLKQAYAHPSDTAYDGVGAKIGVVISADVLDSDTASEFGHERYTQVSGKKPLPVQRYVINGGAPFDLTTNADASYEASIDVQTSLGSAPGAQVTLFSIPTLADNDILAAYTDIVEFNLVDVVSSSFGGCELGYTPAYNNGLDERFILKNYHNVFLQGNAQGITFVASSGDESGLACPSLSYYVSGQPGTWIPGVETPAADPNVTAVGGTNLETSNPTYYPNDMPSKYVSESEYGDPEIPYDPYGLGANVSGGLWGSGGGVSTIFAKPWYQYLVNTGASTYRTVPDISMQMGGCPGGISQLPCQSGDSYSIYFVGGSQGGFIGTSLSAPEFAGVLADEVGASKSRLGNVNPAIYALAAAEAKLPANGSFHFYHQGIPGYNGVVKVAAGQRGYNPIVGVGTPYVANFLGLSKSGLAGNPWTLSNP